MALSSFFQGCLCLFNIKQILALDSLTIQRYLYCLLIMIKNHLKNNAQSLGLEANSLPGSIISMNCEENNSFILFLRQEDYQQSRNLTENTNKAKRCSPLDELQNIYISNFLCRDDQLTTNEFQREQSQQFIQDKQKINKQEAHQKSFQQKQSSILSEYTSKKNKRSHAKKHYSQSGHLCADYAKNIPGYIFKKAIKLLLSAQYRDKLDRACQKWGIDVLSFQQHYNGLYASIYGPQSLTLLFQITSPQDVQMKKMFEHLICRILRGKYLLNGLKEGKMKDISAYIQIKNKYLLYFSKLI